MVYTAEAGAACRGPALLVAASCLGPPFDVTLALPLCLPDPPVPPQHVACAPAEGDLLADQADAVKEFAEFVSQLRRVGTGLGVYEFDRQMAARA